MKGWVSIVLPILTIILVKTQHCRTAAAADSWDLEMINSVSEINNITTTSTLHCTSGSTASIHDCIAPEEEFLMDQSFRRMLADGSSGSVQTLVIKPNVVCPQDSNGRYQCGRVGERKSTAQRCGIYNKDNIACK